MYIYKPALGARGNGIKIMSPGDEISNIETAAVVNRQKKMGYFAAKELLKQLGMDV